MKRIIIAAIALIVAGCAAQQEPPEPLEAPSLDEIEAVLESPERRAEVEAQIEAALTAIENFAAKEGEWLDIVNSVVETCRKHGSYSVSNCGYNMQGGLPVEYDQICEAGFLLSEIQSVSNALKAMWRAFCGPWDRQRRLDEALDSWDRR